MKGPVCYKGRSTKDHGFSWKFYLYLQGFHFYKGLSLKAAYEYFKHDSDSLLVKSNDFNSSVVNSARSLGEWYMHHFIFSVNDDFFKECTWVKPQVSLFYKLPGLLATSKPREDGSRRSHSGEGG